MSPNTYLIGQEAEVCFNGKLIPCSMIQNIEVTFSQDVQEVRGLCGLVYQKKKTPKAEVKLTLLYRNIEVLASLFPQYYTPNAGDCGNMIVGANTCASTATPGAPLNIHPICRTNSCDDLTIWNADPKLDFSYTFSEDDPETIEVTFVGLPAPSTLAGGAANPNAGKVFQFGDNAGTGAESWDCTVQNFV